MLTARRVALPFLVSSLTPLAEAVPLALSFEPSSAASPHSVLTPSAAPGSVVIDSAQLGTQRMVSPLAESQQAESTQAESPRAESPRLASSQSTLAALEALPPHVSDQGKPDDLLQAHDQAVATAIDSSTEDRLERGMLVALGWHESRFAMNVCLGDAHGDEGRAYGCWQSWSQERSGGMPEQARRALDALRKGGNFCAARGHDRLLGSFSLYATGKTCSWPGASRRAQMARNVAARL